MGTKLTNLMAKDGHDVFVTSRAPHEDSGNIHYLQGNAHNTVFLYPLLKRHWDAIIDFMVYTTDEFAMFAPRFLGSTEQYVYLSSCRVFDDSDNVITEKTTKLYETSLDSSYVKSDEYGIKKARQEEILRESGRSNYNIVRPYITYDENRLQLCAMEKEKWLFRAINDKKIVVSEDILNHYTTLTSALDVAYCIAHLLGRKETLSEDYNITCGISLKWSEILDIYISVLKSFGFEGDFVVTPTSMEKRITPYQVLYDRMYDRRFDNSKICSVISRQFLRPENGLKTSLEEFLRQPRFKQISWYDEGRKDLLSGNFEKIHSFKTIKDFLIYSVYRLGIKH